MDQRSLEAAAKSGNFDLLYELIRQDPYIFVEINKVPFVDTPLHVASAAGKTEFAMEIMNLQPSFARKLNADGFTPLHLAVDQGHYLLVLELVKVDPNLVRHKGRQGMTPLLLAVSRNNIDMISEFFLICPESIVDANVNGENALHIAIKNEDERQGLTILKVLMGWILRLCQKEAEWIETRVVNRRDKDGNTPLHLAAYNNNIQAMKTLLKSSKVNVNMENVGGLTVLDVAVLQRQNNNRGSTIERLVKRNGGKRSVSLVKIKKTSDVLASRLTWMESRRTKMVRSYAWISEERRNALLVVAALIITATYQTALQPPGGVFEGGETGSKVPKAGSIVMEEGSFISLWIWNSAGFYIAAVLTLRLLSLGQTSASWYYPLLVPLVVAYNIAGEVISPSHETFTVASCGTIVVLFGGELVDRFVEWVQFKRAKGHEPKSGLVLEGYTTMDQAKGVVAPRGYLVR